MSKLTTLHDYDLKMSISRFMEDITSDDEIFPSPSELGYGSWEFNPRGVRLHLAN